MRITLTTRKIFDVKTLYVRAGVRYWEDGTVNGTRDLEGDLIPCREGDTWCPIIEIETGKIINWTAGFTADIHYKVCDDGNYILKDEKGETITELDGYVPAILCPGDNGYGDYIIMHIDENGMIEDWKIDLSYFESED